MSIQCPSLLFHTMSFTSLINQFALFLASPCFNHHYEIIFYFVSGAFGIVKKGYLKDGTPVALKSIKLKANLTEDDEEHISSKIFEVQREVDIMMCFPSGTSNPYLLRSFGVQLPCTIVIEFAPLGISITITPITPISPISRIPIFIISKYN